MDTALLIIVALVVAGVVLYVNHLLAKKRREAFAAFATQYGFAYAPSNQSLLGQWRGAPFGQGERPRFVNVLTGPFHGRNVVAFDYSYKTHHTDSKGRRRTKTHHYGVVAMRLPGPLPKLEVTHEGIFGGVVANALGFADIQFESERFNRAFRVKADDPRYGHAVIHPQLMETLLARGEIGWRLDGDSILGWDPGKHEPQEVLRRLNLLKEVVDHVPPYVWRDYAGVDPRLG